MSIQDWRLVMTKDIIQNPNSSSTNLPAGLDPTSTSTTCHEPPSNIKAGTKLQFKIFLQMERLSFQSELL
jgi:hypothetical protein